MEKFALKGQTERRTGNEELAEESTAEAAAVAVKTQKNRKELQEDFSCLLSIYLLSCCWYLVVAAFGGLPLASPAVSQSSSLFGLLSRWR